MSDRDRKPRFQRGGGKGPDKGRQFGRRPGGRDREASPDGSVILYGWHTVTAAMANPRRRIRKLLRTENAARRLADDRIELHVTPEIVRPDVIDARLGPDAVHQGLLAEAEPLDSPDIGDLPQEGIVLVLDQITDPHNVGAILRSAAAFGVAGVIVTDRHTPSDTGTLAKSASGALEVVPLVRAVNLARTLDQLKEAGFWIYGLAETGDTRIGDLDLKGRTCIVLGAEGEGLRRLTTEKCDRLVTIPTSDALSALNVSNAAAVAAYEWARQRPK